MGAFFKSFWSQLGRSAGKCVSNAIFGDKWSTPYRVAVDKNKNRYRESSRVDRSKRQYRQSTLNRAENNTPSRPRSYRWLYWLAGFILFAGTYNTILHPSKEDIVLIIMLWGVAIAYILLKKR